MKIRIGEEKVDRGERQICLAKEKALNLIFYLTFLSIMSNTKIRQLDISYPTAIHMIYHEFIYHCITYQTTKHNLCIAWYIFLRIFIQSHKLGFIIVICLCRKGETMLDHESVPVSTHSKTTGLPRKRFFRARAHSNPLSDSHFPVPISPSHFDCSIHFPKFFLPHESSASESIEFADIGCGFGGLLISLSTLFPDKLMIGMELRDKVTEYVKERILALRASNPGQYENVSVVRTNSMKYIPNYFEKAQLSKMFFLFPDPHFKEKNHRRRVISPHLLDEYAYVLKVGGIIYTITDVEELGIWMNSCLDNHMLFEPLSREELEADPVVKLLSSATEEGQKVARNEGQTFLAVYRRIAP